MKSTILNASIAALLSCATAGHAAVTHRYSFSTDASDSVGAANGTLVDGALAGSPTIAGGQLVLNNPGFTGPSSDANCLSMPAGILPASGSVTIEQWFTFAGSGFYTEAWCFSDRNGGANPPSASNGQYLMHTVSNPQGGPNPSGGGSSIAQTLAGYSGGAETRCYSTTVGLGAGGGGYLDDGGTYMCATVIDGSAGTLTYYIYRVSDGVGGPQQTMSNAIPLSSYNFTEAYVGRSPFDGDNATAGSVDEFRIFDTALSPREVAIDSRLGPDDASGDPGSTSSVAVNAEDTIIGGTKQASLTVTYATAGAITFSQDPNLIWSTSDSGKATITQDGHYTGISPGSVDIIATFNGIPHTNTILVGGTILKHRYAFNGAADSNPPFTEPDLVGTADATAWGPGAARLGTGSIELSANPATDTSRTNGYVDLPNGIISSLSSMTLEAWVTPRNSAGGWERIFDVGTTTIGEVLPGNTNAYSGNATDWFYLTAYRDQTPNVSIRRDGSIDQQVVPPGISWYDQLPETEIHVTATYDTVNSEGRVYVNGELNASGPLGGTLATLPDVNVWLGRSMWQSDANLNGLFNEFRIYDGVLSEREVAINDQLGPDDSSGDPGTAGAQSIVADNTVVVGGAKSVRLSVQYSGLSSPVVFQTDQNLTWSSSDTNILLVADDGVMTGVSTGTVTLTASFNGTDSTKSITVIDRALEHRYSFNGPADFSFEFIEPDLVGDADATVYFAADRNGAGQVDLEASSAGYVDLPNGIISPLGSATFEAWVTPRTYPGGGWERIFSFGNTTFQDASRSGEVDEFTLSGYDGGDVVEQTSRVGTDPLLRFLRTAGQMQATDVPYTMDNPIHVVAVYDAAAQQSTVYLNGLPMATDTRAPLLDNLPDVNNWLGRSAYAVDGWFDGLLDEFRIYQGVLTPLEIAVNDATGPDGTPFTDPGNPVSMTVTADKTELVVDVTTAQAHALVDFVNISGVPVNGLGVAWRSGDTNIVTVSDTGFITPVGAGSAIVWARYQNISNYVQVNVVAIIKPITLVHQWSFDGSSGTTVADSVGSADGVVIGTNYQFTGTSLHLFGGGTSFDNTNFPSAAGSYVDLPNGMISVLPGAATFEVWYTWDGTGPNWQNVFSFGIDSNYVEDVVGIGAEDLFLTANSDANTIRTALSTNAPGYSHEYQFNGPAPISGVPVHVVFTWDSDDNLGRMYVNSVLVDSIPGVDYALTQLDDRNSWLGRSQYGGDPMFAGSLHELRIYTGIMTPAEVAAHYAAGSGEPLVRPVLHARLSGTDLILTWTESGMPFSVESTLGLQGTNTMWSPTGLVPVDVNGEKQVTVAIGAVQESYFRLTSQ